MLITSLGLHRASHKLIISYCLLNKCTSAQHRQKLAVNSTATILHYCTAVMYNQVKISFGNMHSGTAKSARKHQPIRWPVLPKTADCISRTNPLPYLFYLCVSPMGIIYFTAVYDFEKVCVSGAATVFLHKKEKKFTLPFQRLYCHWCHLSW